MSKILELIENSTKSAKKIKKLNSDIKDLETRIKKKQAVLEKELKTLEEHFAKQGQDQ